MTSTTLRNVRLPDGSRSVQSVWVWRGFFLMSLIALGLCISFVSSGATFYAVSWAVIAAGWFTLSMWLWRKHLRDDDEAWREKQRQGGGRGQRAGQRPRGRRAA